MNSAKAHDVKYVNGGVIVFFDDNTVDFIKAYESFDGEKAEEYAMGRGYTVHASHLVNGWDEADKLVESWTGRQ